MRDTPVRDMDGSSRQAKKIHLAKKERPARLSVLEFTRIISLLTFRARPSSLSPLPPSGHAAFSGRSLSLYWSKSAVALRQTVRSNDNEGTISHRRVVRGTDKQLAFAENDTITGA